VFNGLLVAELPPLTAVLGRVFLGAAALPRPRRVTGHAMPRSLAAWRAFLGMGAPNNLIPVVLIIEAQTRILGGLATLLHGSPGLRLPGRLARRARPQFSRVGPPCLSRPTPIVGAASRGSGTG
jgi:hypothetical protein